jgi:hypothetical protein
VLAMESLADGYGDDYAARSERLQQDLDHLKGKQQTMNIGTRWIRCIASNEKSSIGS